MSAIGAGRMGVRNSWIWRAVADLAARRAAQGGEKFDESNRWREVSIAGSAKSSMAVGFAYIFCSALVPPLQVKNESVRGPSAMKNVHLQ